MGDNANVLNVQKIISMYGLPELRVQLTIKQQAFADSLGLSQTMISKWHDPALPKTYASFDRLFEICLKYKVSFHQLIQITTDALEASPYLPQVHEEAREKLRMYNQQWMKIDKPIDEAYDSSIPHKRRLEHYENMEYTGFYIHSAHGNVDLSELSIRTEQWYERGFIPLSITVDSKYKYSGKMISPVGTDYTYVYLNRNDDMPERGVLIMYHPQGIDGKLKVCIGVILSLSRGIDHVPTFQQMILLEKDNRLSDKDMRDLISTLRIPLQTEYNPLDRAERNQSTVYKIRVEDLSHAHNKCYHRFVLKEENWIVTSEKNNHEDHPSSNGGFTFNTSSTKQES